MTTTSVERAITEYVAREVIRDGGAGRLDVDFPLMTEKVLDSMDVQRLVAFLETHFAIAITDDWLLPDNFASVRAIARMVTAIQGQS
jgi:acyl carrier protein